MSFEEVLRRFPDAKKNGKGFKAKCPAHEDNNPSLKITEGVDGKILFYCHAQCTPADVAAAIGLDMSDLFPVSKAKKAPPVKMPKAASRRSDSDIAATYDYRDEDGKLLFQAVRYANPKDFRQRQPNGNGWRWTLDNVRLVIYRLPELLAAHPDAEVFIFEGEKDCDRLAAEGLIVTTNPMGAGKWRKEFGERWLSGRRVVIVPDNDKTGRTHAEAVARSLQGVAKSVKVLELPGLPDKGDVSDWLDAGGDAEQLCKLVDGCAEWIPVTTKTAAPAPALTISGKIEHEEVFRLILDQLVEVDFRVEADLGSADKITQKHFAVIAIEKIVAVAQAINAGICRNGNLVYVFNSQYWRQIEADELAKFLGEAAEKLGVEKYTARFCQFRDLLSKQFRATAYLPTPKTKQGVTLINLANGTFEITAAVQTLRDFRRDDFLTYQLPFEYDPNASCATWRTFLSEVLPDKDQAREKICAEYIGYCFTRLKLEQVLMPFGEGANGKSVYFDVMTALLGEENISHFSLQSLGHEYNRAKLTNKLLNYSSEISSRLDTDIFKKLASGEPIEARLPYEQPFLLRTYARLAFNCNELPREIEHSEAFFRRFLIIPFDVTIAEAKRNPELANEIIATELPGVFNWMLEGLNRLLKQKKFTKCEQIDKALADYRSSADSVALFLVDEGWQADSKAPMVSLKQLYQDYKEYCRDSGYKPLGRNKFGKRLENNGVERVDTFQPFYRLVRT